MHDYSEWIKKRYSFSNKLCKFYEVSAFADVTVDANNNLLNNEESNKAFLELSNSPEQIGYSKTPLFLIILKKYKPLKQDYRTLPLTAKNKSILLSSISIQYSNGTAIQTDT